MKKIAFVILLLLVALGLCSCRSNPLKAEQIKETLPKEVTELIINDPFDSTNNDVYQLSVNSVEIEKRQTNDKSDVVWCAIEMENEYYRYTRFITCHYSFYDEGGWLLDNWEENREPEWTVLQNPFHENAASAQYIYLVTDNAYSDIGESSVSFDGINTVVYTTMLERKTDIYTVSGPVVERLTFDGTSWSHEVDRSGQSKSWDLNHTWMYYDEGDTGLLTGCLLEITGFDPETNKMTGTCKVRYPTYSPTNFQWNQGGFDCDLSKSEIEVGDDYLTILLYLGHYPRHYIISNID